MDIYICIYICVYMYGLLPVSTAIASATDTLTGSAWIFSSIQCCLGLCDWFDCYVL